MAARNWLLVLGLDFDPVTDDHKYIESAVEDKKKFWASHSMDQLNGSYYRSMLDSADLIKSQVLDEETRQELACKAREMVYGRLDTFLKIAAGAAGADDDIESSAIQLVANKLSKRICKDEGIKGWEYPVDRVKARAEKLGYIIIDDSAGGNDDDALAAYAPYADKKRWTKFKSLSDALKNFGAIDVYEFAFPGSGAAGHAQANDKILASLKNIHDEKAIHHNQEKTDAEVIFNMGKGIFDSAEHRAEYDEFLEYQQVNRILDGLNELVALSNDEVSEELFKKTEGEVTHVLSDKGRAPLVVKGYCLKKKLRFKRPADTVYCRCGRANSLAATRCSGCGLPMKLTCPKCGKSVANTSNYCDCGAPLGKKIQDAETQCDRAECLLGNFELKEARDCLESARRSWQEYNRYDDIDRRLSEMERTIGSVVSKLKSSIESKRFFEAQDALKSARSRYRGFRLASGEESLIEAGVSQANALVDRAKSADAREKLSLYASALAASADCAEALAYMQCHSPEPPEGVKAYVDAQAGVVRLSWRPSPAEGVITYVVCRKVGSAPASPADGVLVAKTNVLQAEDSSAESGQPYYYAVFAQRFGVASIGSPTRAAVYILNEVEELVVTPGDSLVEFKWKSLPGNAKVEIVEETGCGQLLERVSLSHYIHSNLQNGSTYRYRVCVVYNVMGTELKTEGLAIEATPLNSGEAVNDLRSVRDKNSPGVFHLSWTEKPGVDIAVYGVMDKSRVPASESLLSLSELNRTCRHVDLHNRTCGSAELRYDEDIPIFVFSVVVCGKTAIVGNSCRISNKEEIRIVDVYNVNDEIAIRIAPPPQAVGYVVLTRSDRFVADISESGRDGDQTRKQITKKNYEQNGMLLIKYAGARDYYISVFAMYGTPSAPTYSEPTEYLFSAKPKDKITYSIQVAKMPFMAPRVTISFRSTNHDFVLPATSIVCGAGKLPVFAGEGMQLMSIPEKRVTGELSIEVTNIPKRKNLYLKALPVDSAIESYSLDQRSNSKIC